MVCFQEFEIKQKSQRVERANVHRGLSPSGIRIGSSLYILPHVSSVAVVNTDQKGTAWAEPGSGHLSPPVWVRGWPSAKLWPLFHWYVDLDSLISSLGNEKWALGSTLASDKLRRPHLSRPKPEGVLHSQRGISEAVKEGNPQVLFQRKWEDNARKGSLSCNTHGGLCFSFHPWSSHTLPWDQR